MIPIRLAKFITGQQYIAHALAVMPSMRKGVYTVHLRNFGNVARTLRTFDQASVAQLEQVLTENRVVGFSPSPLRRVLRLLTKRLGEIQQSEPAWEQTDGETVLTTGRLRMRINPGHPSWFVRAYYWLCVAIYRYPKPQHWMRYELTLVDPDDSSYRRGYRLTAVLRNLLHAGAAISVGVLASLQSTVLAWTLVLVFGLLALAFVFKACDHAAIRHFARDKR